MAIPPHAPETRKLEVGTRGSSRKCSRALPHTGKLLLLLVLLLLMLLLLLRGAARNMLLLLLLLRGVGAGARRVLNGARSNQRPPPLPGQVFGRL